MKPINKVIMGCVFSCASTFAFSAPQYFNFVLNPAQSSVSATYSNASHFDCGWAPSLPCDYRISYVLTGSFTLVRDLDAGFYSPTEGRYYDTDMIENMNITATWVGAQPLGSNPAWSAPPLPDKTLNMWLTTVGSIYVPASGRTFIPTTDWRDAFFGTFDDGRYINDEYSYCLEPGPGSCMNRLEGTLNASLVPIPGAGVLFLSGAVTLLYGRRRAVAGASRS